MVIRISNGSENKRQLPQRKIARICPKFPPLPYGNKDTSFGALRLIDAAKIKVVDTDV